MTAIEKHKLGTIQEVLAKKFKGADSKQHAILFELRNGTGFRSQDRYLDAFVMDTWPSSGFTRRAYEIKTSRSDFLRELKDPSKRQWGLEISNEFWFLCAPDVAKAEEIPENCGLMVLSKNSDKFRTLKVAPHREARELTMAEVCAIARRANEGAVLADQRWKYRDKELTVADLDDLVKDHLEQWQQREVERLAKIKAAEFTAELDMALKAYAEKMRAVGIEPPGFFNGITKHRPTTWDADQWVKANLAPGPAANQIKRALQEIECATRSVAAAHAHVNKLNN